MSVLTRRRIDQRRMDRYMLLLSAQMMLQIVPRCSWYMTKSYQESTCLPDMPRVSHWSILTDNNIPLHMDLCSQTTLVRSRRRIDQHHIVHCMLPSSSRSHCRKVPQHTGCTMQHQPASRILPDKSQGWHSLLLLGRRILD